MREFVHTPLMDAASGATPQESRSGDLCIRRCRKCGDFYEESFVAQHEANGCIPRTPAPCEPPADLFRKWWKQEEAA